MKVYEYQSKSVLELISLYILNLILFLTKRSYKNLIYNFGFRSL